MKRSKIILLFFTMLFTFIQISVIAQMEFVQNKGQWESVINYKTDFESGSFYLHKNGFTVNLIDSSDVRKIARLSHIKTAEKYEEGKKFMVHSFAYNVSLIGANSNPTLVPDKPLPTYNNYFIGNDKTKWASDCKIYNAVTYENIYPNIDIRYYSTKNTLKYDFIVHPGGNPSIIQLQYNGVNSLQIEKGNLIIGTSIGNVKELEPYSYQADINSPNDVATKFVIKNNIVKFDIAKYNKNATLVIDPQLIFCSFVKSTTDNWGYTATPGNDGSFYSGGIDFGTGFPTTNGAYQTAFNGGEYDISIFKFSSNGTQRLYATFIGGDNQEQPHSMIADSLGNIFIAGRSNSSNYPTLTSIPNTGSGYDIVITKLNPTGTAILGSVKIGGSADDGVNIGDKEVSPFGTLSIRQNYGDDARSEIILDANNNVILASCSKSNNFPLLNPLQATFGGQQDGVILKLNPTLNNLIFSTYFGGSGDDACFVAEINKLNGNLYVGGATSSNDLPGNTQGTIGVSSFGGIDGYITILQPNGSAIVKTSYIGTSGIDAVYGLKFDHSGFPYIMGSSTGSMPISSNVLYSVPGAKHYIAKLQQNLSAFVYSTLFGKADPLPSISPIAFLVDKCENVYVSGWGGQVNTITGYANSGTQGLPEINQLPNLPSADGSDFYFFVLKKNAQAQLFGSHFGQNGGAGDHVDGGTSRFDENGIIYQAICANCLGFGPAAFPTYPTGPTFPWSSVNPSPNCNLAAAKINLDFSAVSAGVQSSIAGVVGDTLGCYPILVSFRDSLQRGVKYFWNFDSQNFPNNTDAITTNPNTNHIFTTGGIFRVRLIAEDSSTCNIRDTSYINIYITNRVVNKNITASKIGLCTDYKFQFTNNSTASDATTFTNQSFVWDYGDGSPKDTVNKTPARVHTFPGTGTYYVTMKTIDRRFCNTPIIDTIKIVINPNIISKPLPIVLNCGEKGGLFTNQSTFAPTGTATWKWEFVNATTGAVLSTSNLFEPTYFFPSQGLYKYRLVATDPNACNLADTSAYINLTVINKPTALFTYTPNPPQVNTPFSFINLSTLATSYLWSFGDGQSSTLFEPTHEYLRKQPYNVQLIAYNRFNSLTCTDTAQLTVNSDIDPLLDVPNAFTPGKFGANGIVHVRGFGIEKMVWKIYNRWGQLIFTSTDKNQGWNGFYKGKLQPTDVYTYTLDATFIDGVVKRKTGDITLLR